MSMEFIVAKNIGFCFGVKRAVDMALELAKEHGRIFTYGELIHNNDVISDLEKQGIKAIESLDEVAGGDILLIRAHGVPKHVYEECERRGICLFDATCPFVKKIHGIVSYNCTDRRIVIIGTKKHPETVGIAGNCKEAYIVQDESDLDGFDFSGKVCIVSQTTFLREKFLHLAELIKSKCSDAVVFDTTCNTTRDRQKEAEVLSKTCDAMIVFGSPHSSNTKKLADICRKNCKNVICTEHGGEYLLDLMPKAGRIGVVGGASTPEETVRRSISQQQ